MGQGLACASFLCSVPELGCKDCIRVTMQARTIMLAMSSSGGAELKALHGFTRKDCLQQGTTRNLRAVPSASAQVIVHLHVLVIKVTTACRVVVQNLEDLIVCFGVPAQSSGTVAGNLQSRQRHAGGQPFTVAHAQPRMQNGSSCSHVPAAHPQHLTLGFGCSFCGGMVFSSKWIPNRLCG